MIKMDNHGCLRGITNKELLQIYVIRKTFSTIIRYDSNITNHDLGTVKEVMRTIILKRKLNTVQLTYQG